MYRLFIIFSLSVIFASEYGIGDTVSIEHQNSPFEVHYGDYPADTLRLSDQSGKIIIFGLSASWWPTVCTTSLEALLDSYNHDPRIFIFENLDDPGQPYTYEQWGDMAQDGIPIIVDDIGATIGEYTLFDWFSINNYYMEMVVLDHNMVFRRLTTSTYLVESEIQTILSEPGWVEGDINNDESADILDVLIIINTIVYGDDYYFGYDMNNDDIVNILDIMFLVDIIMYD